MNLYGGPHRKVQKNEIGQDFYSSEIHFLDCGPFFQLCGAGHTGMPGTGGRQIPCGHLNFWEGLAEELVGKLAVKEDRLDLRIGLLPPYLRSKMANSFFQLHLDR